MTILAIALISFGLLLILSVALNSWESSWHTLTGQANVADQLIKATAGG